jgi:hypothetical protein
MSTRQPDYVFPAVDSLLSQQLTTNGDYTGIINKIHTSENGNLSDSVNLADTNSNQALVYGMYLSRNKTIADAAVDLTIQNQMFDNGTSETYARQGEINEWEAQNKFDTLFFLQCMFLYLSMFVILIFLWRKGILPASTYYWIITIMTIIVAGILFNRSMYTSKMRDNRYWNRRYVTLDKNLQDPTPTCKNPPPVDSTQTAPAGANAEVYAGSSFSTSQFQ